MSRLDDKIQGASRGGLRTIGFGIAERARAAPLVLLARLRSADAAQSGQGIEAGADAIVLTFEGAESIASLSWDAGEAIWGAYLPAMSRQNADALKEMGCDFVVFRAEGTEAVVLREADMGKVMHIDGEIADSSAMALQTFSLDALWVGAAAISRLTVREVAALRRLALLARKPLLLELPADFGLESLEGLLGSGTVGVVMDWVSEADSTRLASLRQAIDALPRTERKERAEKALLPSLAEPHPEEEL